MLKLSTPKDVLVQKGLGWSADYSASSVRGIGALEVLGGVGLVLPALVHIVPILVPIAAVGVAFVMAGAVVVHLRRKEIPEALPALAARNRLIAEHLNRMEDDHTCTSSIFGRW